MHLDELPENLRGDQKSDPAVDRKEKTQDRAAVINASSGDPGPSEKEPRTIGETAGKTESGGSEKAA